MVRVGPQRCREKNQNRSMYVKVDICGEIQIINTYSEVEVLR
jgi:hypothetical protein